MPSLCEQPKPPSRVYAKMREGDRERLSKLASGASGAVEGVATAQTNSSLLPPRDPSLRSRMTRGGDNGTSLIEIMVSLQKLRLNILRSNLNRNHESP